MTAMIVTAARIHTADRRRLSVKALAIQGDRVVATGSFDEARRAVGEHATVLDLGDATVVPGLIDAHNHMLWTGLERRLVDLTGARSIADVLAAVSSWSAAHPGVQWVLSGEGWHVDDLAERRYPKRDELDRACPDQPVFLGRGGHAGAVNSRALEIAGVDAATPDPPGGVVERHPDGTPTGVLLEGPARELVLAHIPPVAQKERRAAVRDVQADYLAAGLTRVQEPGLEHDELAAYQDLHAAGELAVRVTAMPQVRPGVPIEGQLERLGGLGARTGMGDEWLRLGGLKVYFDGAASFGTARLREPWPRRDNYLGELVTSPEDLERLTRFCAARRWSVGVHVVGGGGIDLAFSAFARANAEHPIGDLRFTLIHAYLWPSADNMAQARDLGVVVATQPTMQERFAGLLAEHFGWDAIGRATPLRSWLDAGVRVAGSSDSPVTPYAPLRGIWQAVTRHCTPFGGPLGPTQRIDADAALRMYTCEAAHACFSEHLDGALRPGGLADFIALDADPLCVPPAELRDIPVLLTAVGGRVLHDRR